MPAPAALALREERTAAYPRPKGCIGNSAVDHFGIRRIAGQRERLAAARLPSVYLGTMRSERGGDGGAFSDHCAFVPPNHCISATPTDRRHAREAERSQAC